jgi:hypothetical protein
MSLFSVTKYVGVEHVINFDIFCQIKEMFVSGGTTDVEANMLKGIMSQWQLNTQAVNLVKNRQNNLPLPDSNSAQYNVMEVTNSRLRTL